MNGLYVITSEQMRGQMCLQVAQAIAGGASMVQYRHKNISYKQQLWEAQDLQILCRSLSVPLIINDDAKIAKKVDADGVHLGAGDGSIADARALLGNDAIIGVSCYGNLAFALEAQNKGANYVAFGRFFASKSKPNAKPVDVSILQKARQILDIPIAAIGGINVENSQILIKAGADMLAVINGVFGDEVPKNAATQICTKIAECS